jgi:hypothetical protein
MRMRVLSATALAVATVAAFCFLGALPALFYVPAEGFEGGELFGLGMYFLFGLGFGVMAAAWVFIFALAYLTPSSPKGATLNFKRDH